MSRLDDIFGSACSVFATFSANKASGYSIQKAFSKPDADSQLSATERQLSESLMRVNHVGEVCAQALYEAQALAAKTPSQRESLLVAAAEEADHLRWTGARLSELGGRPSYLNPVWYAGSFTIGLIAASRSDAVSLGFVRETERQVEAHLASHLERLPLADKRSRALVERMRADEKRHADAAEAAGAVDLPSWVPTVMRWSAKLMTRTAHYI